MTILDWLNNVHQLDIYIVWFILVILFCLSIRIITRSILLALYTFYAINLFNIAWSFLTFDMAFLYPMMWSFIALFITGVYGLNITLMYGGVSKK